MTANWLCRPPGATIPPAVMTGEQLRQIRFGLGLSLDAFGDMLGLMGRNRAVRRYEDGERAISGPIANLALALASGWRPPPAGLDMELRIAEALLTGRLAQRLADDAEGREAQRFAGGPGIPGPARRHRRDDAVNGGHALRGAMFALVGLAVLFAPGWVALAGLVFLAAVIVRDGVLGRERGREPIDG